MRRLILPLVLIAAPVAAQDTQEDRDRGFLVALIEDNLAAPGLSVRLDGFEGALSSEATLERLSVADDEGTWLVLEDVTLAWNRSALLRGRLEVAELSADLIRLDRPPLPPEGVEALPDAGASGFALPNLPVSVDVDLIQAERIELGDAILGQAAALSLTGSANLADGSGGATIEAERLDGPDGVFSIAASYGADTQDLRLDIQLSEAEGGLAATLLQLPGAPGIDLTIQGAGPLDAFAADIALASDGQDRLAGSVTLAGTDAGRRFEANLGGDVTALFAPTYRPFFGDDVRLEVSGTAQNEGGTDLETLRLDTQALRLTGEARIGADGWPSFIDVDGLVASADGTPVVLPTADAATLNRAELSISLDAAQSDAFRMTFDIDGFDGAAAALASGNIDLSGTLTREGSLVQAAEAAFEIALDGLDLADENLAEAVGAAAQFTGDVDWERDQPIRISDLALGGTGYDLTGDVVLTTTPAGLTVSPDLSAQLEDLGRLSGIAGQALAGSASVSVSGDLAPGGGTFDLAVAGGADGLAIGVPQADALLEGQTNLTIQARRTPEGTFLDVLDLRNPQLSLTGEAGLVDEEALAAGQTGRAVLEARIEDGLRIDPRLDGPITLTVDLGQGIGGLWSGNVAAAAPEGVTISAEGILTGPTPDVIFETDIPNLSAFVNGVPGGVTLSGRAFAESEIWSLEADAAGPWGLTAQVSGPVTGENADIAFAARLPDLSGPVPAVGNIEALAGALTLNGTLARDGEIWVLDTGIQAPAGITVGAQGPVTGGAARLDVTARVPELGDFVPDLQGPLSLDAVLEQQGADWLANLIVDGPADTQVTVDSTLTATPLRVEFTARAPDVSALVPAVPGNLDISGAALQTDTGWDVTVAGTGPYAVMLDASASLSDGVLSATAMGRLPESSELVPQLRGPLDFAAAARQVDGQWDVEAEVSGAQDLSVSVDGLATGPAADLSFQARAGNVAPFVPGLSGPLTAEGRLFQRDGDWAIDLDASGPLGAALSADGTLTGAPEAAFDLSVPNIGPLLPDFPGPLRVSGTAAQSGTDWTVDVTADGPSGAQAAVAGTVGSGGTLNLDTTGSVPLGVANRVLAPRRLAGLATFQLSVNGPPGLGSVSGTITTADAALSLPTLRNGFEDIDATITLGGGSAQIDLGAALQSGGRIAVTGPVALSAPFQAGLGIDVDVTLEDPSLYTARIVGDVSIAGPLTGGALISGGLTVDGAEISVPSSGLTSIGDLPPIQHISTTRPIMRTLERAGQLQSADDVDGGGGGAVYDLDLFVNVPGRVFIRGRGLDAELGGRIGITGTSANPVTAGGIELIRGRLDLLDQRFDLDEGSVTFQGSFIPNLRLVANTETPDLDASIIIEGPADAIQVRFESSPELPDEEILAQIFFGRNLSQLSPFQAVQLANSIAVLAGRGSGGLLNNIRGTAGLDDLDVTTNDDGTVGVRAGAYLSENVYTDVQVDNDGGAEVSLNLDLRPDLTIRGGANETSDASLGIFFERDY